MKIYQSNSKSASGLVNSDKFYCISKLIRSFSFEKCNNGNLDIATGYHQIEIRYANRNTLLFFKSLKIILIINSRLMIHDRFPVNSSIKNNIAHHFKKNFPTEK